MQKIILSDLQKQILSNHADNERPNESCAILFGTENEGKSKVERVFLTKNIDQSPVNFTISAEQRLEADKMEKELQLKIIGIFHSHPDSKAFPSMTDKKFMDLNPVVWVIFSGISKDFKAYVLESEILEIPIEME
ncbi:MAG: M67 family metallopeptidase [Nitrosopumilus sp.]|nr:M67 family metallopeptidase [Nitrosopumilus sp.]MDH3824984.1 M67 family metallopeptidase [Nitrosopumilus sp.]